MPSKQDAAVERLVKKNQATGISRQYLTAVTREAFNAGRQSAARECAEIADKTNSHGVFIGDQIRTHFGLEGK